VRVFSVLALFPLLCACDSDQPIPERAREEVEVSARDGFHDSTIVLEDANGRELTFRTPPQRIISLIPSASEIMVALGAGSLLVGRTDFDTSPSVTHLPSVGGGLHPNLEAIVALEPDLVIRFAGESDPATPIRLDDLGIPHMALRPDGIRDIRGSILTLGTLAQRVEEAEALLEGIDTTLAEIRARVGGRPRVRVGYLLGGTPPWVAGPGSYIEELLELAGGTNVFSDLTGLYGPVNEEIFLVREIDLLLAPEGVEVSFPERGIPLRRVSPSLEIPGPDLAQNAWALARILHPEAFR